MNWVKWQPTPVFLPGESHGHRSLVGYSPQGCKVGYHWSGFHARMQGLPLWLSGKESTCQCKRHSFNPWVGKIPWRRKWQPTSTYLPGKSHGQRNPVGYSPWGHKRVRQDLTTKQQQRVTHAQTNISTLSERDKMVLVMMMTGQWPVHSYWVHTLPGVLQAHVTGDRSSVHLQPRSVLAVRVEAADTA